MLPASRVGLSSRKADSMQVNDDGSYDAYLVPEAPKGKVSNWIPTGEDFFLLFRLYGPDGKNWFKNRILDDLVKLN